MRLSRIGSITLMGVVNGDSQADIFSGTKNGASYQARVRLSNEETRIAMQWAVTYLDTGYFPSSKGLNRFNTGNSSTL